MDPQRPNKILDEWNSVSASVRPPAAPPRGIVVRSRLAGPGLVGGGLLIAGLLVAVVWLGRPGPNGGVGDVPSVPPSASQSAVADPPATPVTPPSATPATPTVQPSATPKAAPTPTLPPHPDPAIPPCKPANLAARINSWQGAAGNRIAEIALTNTSSDLCIIAATAKPQLVDSKGSILINGSTPKSTATRKFEPKETFKTLVDVANYCGKAPVGFVTVAFVLPDGAGRVVATPLSPTDATIPPCNSAPGTPGDIAMHDWAP